MDVSEDYSLQFRGLLGKNGAKIYSDNALFEVSNELEFDVKGETNTSINYFVSSVLSAILLNIRRDVLIVKLSGFEIELSASVSLKHPLTHINVIGYEESPYIKNIKVKAYVYGDGEEEEIVYICKKAVNKSFICNTLINAGILQIEYIVML